MKRLTLAFKLLRFGTKWHGQLDVGNQRFVHWSRSRAVAWLGVWFQARAALGAHFKLRAHDPNCQSPKCQLPF